MPRCRCGWGRRSRPARRYIWCALKTDLPPSLSCADCFRWRVRCKHIMMKAERERTYEMEQVIGLAVGGRQPRPGRSVQAQAHTALRRRLVHAQPEFLALAGPDPRG